ncbi:MAG: penicillin-binding protein 2 [Actinomycetota bacterium]|nr:penicillin-binding protein 2 [Actinomycetota bacterium]
MFVLFVLAYSAMGARLFVLQIMDAPAYAQRALDQRQREITFPARRGAILDRNGEPLAISVDLNSVFTDPAHVEDARSAARKLAPVLGVEASELAGKLRGTSPGDRFEYLARQVSPEVARRVRALDLPGVYMEAEPKRYYPGGKLAAHLLGFADIDGLGVAGLELQYEDILRGTPGKMVLEQDPAGRPLPQAEFEHVPAHPGRSLVLTIDKDIQYFTQLTLRQATARFGAVAGTAIVMRPGTGEILALANTPDYDPNRAGDSPADAQRNRALTDVYEPGSAYKIVTAAAALEEGVVTPKTSFVVADSQQIADRVIHDSHAHPTEKMSVTEIIEQSSNVGTVQIGIKVGKDTLDSYIRRFGFGERTGLDFPGESPGIVIDKDDWSGSTIGTVPIGQGIAATALQMASAYATVANDGVKLEPKLLSATMNDRGLEPSARSAARRVVSRATASALTRILTGVVERGTGIEAQIPGYDVAGKTGTAQKPAADGGYGDTYVASFAGFAPARRPAVVVIVVLDEPTPIWGGTTAAPTFRTITQYALRHLGVSPTGNAVRAAREIETEQAGAPAAHD